MVSKTFTTACIIICLFASGAVAQNRDSLVVQQIMQEANDNSQLQKLAVELIDGIGPRLVGTPQMQQANDWAVNTYKKWGITARNEKWGEWRGWQRGVSHIDMICLLYTSPSPRDS